MLIHRYQKSETAGGTECDRACHNVIKAVSVLKFLLSPVFFPFEVNRLLQNSPKQRSEVLKPSVGLLQIILSE